ncbi:MAG: c-type cytochrome [Pseudomonadota bacterium]
MNVGQEKSTIKQVAGKFFAGAVWAVLICVSPPGTAGETSVKADLNPAAIFHNYCSICHGEKGNGQSKAVYALVPPPRDFTAFTIDELPREQMIYAVTHGRPGTAMVSWTTQLSAAEIEAVVDYVRATFMKFEGNTAAGRGRIVYMEACAVCHGEDGKREIWGAQMGPRPPNFNSQQVTEGWTRQRMVTSVQQGRAGSAMMGFAGKYSQEDIEATVDYIREAFIPAAGTAGISGVRARRAKELKPDEPSPHPSHGDIGVLLDNLLGHFMSSANAAEVKSKSKAAAANVNGARPAEESADMSLPLPKGLKGDAEKGGQFFMTNCYTCHGATGGGDGPRAYFINPPPRNFLLESSRKRLNRPVIFNAISQGIVRSEMPAWNKVLSDQEIANVAEFVFQQFISGNAQK